MTDTISIILSLTNDISDGIDSATDSVDGLQASIERASESETELQGAVNEANSSINSIDSSSLDEVSTASNQADLSLQSVQEAASVANGGLELISPNTLESVSTSATEAQSSLSSVNSTVGSVDSALNGIDGASINEAASAASALGSDLSSVDGDAKTVDTALDSISSDSLSGVSGAASSAGSGLADVAGQATETAAELDTAASSSDLLMTAMAGIAAIGIGSWFSSAISAAGAYNDSWSRLSIAMGTAGEAASQVQSEWSGAISTMTNETGRGAGVVRSYIIQMGLAGVTSKQTLEDAFSGISGAAFTTGNTIDQIEAAFTRVVKTGTFSARQLVALGLTTQDVQKATGLSVEEVSKKLQGMDTNARAAYLSMIVNAKYGTAANDEYKMSWAHVTDELSLAYQYLQRIIGGLLLPVVIPAITTASSALSTVAGWVDKASGSTKTLLGVIIGGLAGIVVVTAAVTTISRMMELLGLNTLLTAARTGLNTIANWANALSYYGSAASMDVAAGAAAAHAGAVAVDTAATEEGLISRIANTVATAASTAVNIAAAAAIWVVTAAQTALNAVMDANPIAIVVIAIVALIAILMYLYNTNETVRNALNGLWSDLQKLGQYIYGGLITAWNQLTETVGKFVSQIMSGDWGGAANTIKEAFIGLKDDIVKVFGDLWNYLSKIDWHAIGWAIVLAIASIDWYGLGLDIYNGIISGLGQIGGYIYSVLQGAWSSLSSIDWGAVGSTILSSLESSISSGASNIVDLGAKVIQWLIDGLLSVATNLDTILTQLLDDWGTGDGQAAGQEAGQNAGEAGGKSAGTGFIVRLTEWIQQNGPTIVDTIVKIFEQLLPLLALVALKLGEVIILYLLKSLVQGLGQLNGIILQAMATAATNAGNAFLNNIMLPLMMLPIQIVTWLGLVVVQVALWALQLGMQGQQAGNSFVNGIILFIQQLPGRIWGILLSVLMYILSFGGTAGANARNAGNQILQGVVSYVQQLPGHIWSLLLQMAARVLGIGGTAGGNARSVGNQILNGLRNTVSQAPGIVYSEMIQIGQRILSVGGTLYSYAANVGNQIVAGIKAGAGIHSPGYAYWAISGELDRMIKVMGDKGDVLSSKAYDVGSSIAESFTDSVDSNIDASLKDSLINNDSSNAELLKNTTSTVKLEHKLTLDLKNVPNSMDEETLLKAIEAMIKSRGVLNWINEGIGKLAKKTKTDGGI